MGMCHVSIQGLHLQYVVISTSCRILHSPALLEWDRSQLDHGKRKKWGEMLTYTFNFNPNLEHLHPSLSFQRRKNPPLPIWTYPPLRYNLPERTHGHHRKKKKVFKRHFVAWEWRITTRTHHFMDPSTSPKRATISERGKYHYYVIVLNNIFHE